MTSRPTFLPPSLRSLAAYSLALGVALGCAGERDPVNRVQSNYVSKSIFVRPDKDGQYLKDSDKWYFRATITDVPATQSAAFIGAAGEMYRVRWQVEENFLFAYRDDEEVLGTSGNEKDKKVSGPIAAFPIVSHFDIRRQFNPGTGEELNVVEENTVDRVWQKREYMRVDWSTNRVSQSAFTFPAFESVSAATYFEQDPDSYDKPIFSNDYIDVSAHYTVQPDITTCYYTYRDLGCTPGDITARLSFMKVPTRDYVPREYPDRLVMTKPDGSSIRTIGGSEVSLPVMDQFGFFRTERAQYDQRFGTLEKRYVYRANQWNLWDQWFRRDAQGNVLSESGGIRQGNEAPALLPYAERKVRPIVYHVNPDFPEALKPIAKETAEGWNTTFQETVASLRLLEARGKDAAISQAELRAEVDAMKARGENVFVGCLNNPVAVGDPSVCGAPGTAPRVGDLRYSFMHWVPKPQPSGPLGFGPSYGDPETGELFSAAAFIYGASLDTYAQQAVDIVNLLNGKLADFDYLNGISTEDYVRNLNKGEVPGPNASAADVPAPPGSPGFSLEKTKAMVDRVVDKSLLSAIGQQGIPQGTGGGAKEKLEALLQTPIGRKLLDSAETRLLVNKGPKDELSDSDLKSISDIMVGKENIARERERMNFLGTHGCYYAKEFADESIVGLARAMATKYPFKSTDTAKVREEQQLSIWRELREHILRGVLMHEVGHTVGLRHNFEGSSDSINFFDEYWTLKQETLAFGAAMTQKQIDGRMPEFQYTSIMDYGARFNSDIHGLGKYDHAAIRFGYGNLVEAWPKGKIVDPLYNSTPRALGANRFTGYSAEILDDVNRDFRHYTQIPKEFSDGIASIQSGGRQIRRFEDVFENAQALYRASVATTSAGTVKTNSANNGIDVVPYRYCGDEFAGSANKPLCQRWDQGVDAFEVVQDAMDRYKQYYVFDAFTRGSATGAAKLRGYLSRISTRYFSHIHSQYIHWLFYQSGQDYTWRSILDRNGTGIAAGYITDPNWYKDPGGGLASTLATTWGLDQLVNVLATPDVGVYADVDDDNVLDQLSSDVFACQDANRNARRCAASADQLPLDIALGARYRFTKYDGASGQGYFNRIKSVGAFYDKIAALITLTNSDTNFVGTDTTNAVSYRIGFFLAYPKVMTRLFGGIITDQHDNYAWRYKYDSSNAKPVQLLSRDLFQSSGRVDGNAAPSAPLVGNAIDGGWYFFYKAYALFFSMAEFQSNYSQSWNDAVRVYCVGCGESFTPAPGTTVVSVNDPNSGKQYAAIRYGDGRYSPGAELVLQTQKELDKLRAAEALPDVDPEKATRVQIALSRYNDQIELMDLVRGLYNSLGYSKF